jgi:histidyl-tRNA synthetase
MSSTEFRPKARRPRGFDDKRAARLKQERAIVEQVLSVYERWGFERIETSAFEYADALGKFLPDDDRPNEGVFALQDDDGEAQWMALRYDLTAPLARFAAEHWDSLPKPFRRCAAGPVWRNEKPGPGRFREFWQCDADTVGSAKPAADAEMVAMACEAYRAIGLAPERFVLKVSSRKLLDGLLEGAGVGAEERGKRLAVLRAIDKLDRLGPDGVRALLGDGRMDESGDFTKGAGLRPEAIETVIAFATAQSDGSRADTLTRLEAVIGSTAQGRAGIADLWAMDATLAALGAGAAQVRFDTSVVRGLEYYTGAVFEAELLGDALDDQGRPVRFGSIGGGGRYDDLVSRFRGEPVPATGFSVGVSRLAAALSMTAGERTTEEGPVVVLVMDAAEIADSFAMAADLRAGGVAAEVYLGASGMKAQLKYADKRASPIAVIVGSDERAAGTVTLKNLKLGARLAASAGEDREKYAALREGVQRTVARAELAASVRAMLAQG